MKLRMLFPAYAGVIPGEQNKKAPALSFPRLRGGDPSVLSVAMFTKDFSPPTRG